MHESVLQNVLWFFVWSHVVFTAWQTILELAVSVCVVCIFNDIAHPYIHHLCFFPVLQDIYLDLDDFPVHAAAAEEDTSDQGGKRSNNVRTNFTMYVSDIANPAFIRMKISYFGMYMVFTHFWGDAYRTLYGKLCGYNLFKSKMIMHVVIAELRLGLNCNQLRIVWWSVWEQSVTIFKYSFGITSWSDGKWYTWCSCQNCSGEFVTSMLQSKVNKHSVTGVD